MRHQTVSRNFLNGFWRGIGTAVMNIIVMVWAVSAVAIVAIVMVGLAVAIVRGAP